MGDHAPTLVLGGTGKTGSRVVRRLTGRDLPVRIGSRSGGVPFDWEDPATWQPALQGVRAVYMSYYPDLAVPGAPEAIGSLAELAVAGGARRLVLLSGRGEEEAGAAEEALRASGADWTILRCSWFNQNFSESYLLDPVLAGQVVLPAGQVPEPFVDADDIADVAAAALTDDRHVGEVYELTGPRLLTFADAVAAIAEASGRDIGFVQVSAEEYASALLAEQVPVEVVDLLTYLFTTVLDGRNAHLGDGVQRVLGRQPRDFADYARETAATGIWNQG
ncbi:NAD(P)H-binding protein [Streptosporangium sp. NPDC051023]|uniref:NAD(P)H-binding protein n=1 Tax=Streptosporangium sp. NPDC051023 TaxID=3155410 RepID=UPI0034500C8E